MRLLRFLVLSFCVACLFLLPSFAQTAPDTQNSSTFKTSPADRADLQKQVQKMLAQGLEHGGQRELPPLRRQRKDLEAKPVLGDPGIVLRPASRECWSIVAYHFSHEQNPRLESVTTCTPANGIVMRRARRDKEYQPPTPPHLVETNLVVK